MTELTPEYIEKVRERAQLAINGALVDVLDTSKMRWINAPLANLIWFERAEAVWEDQDHTVNWNSKTMKFYEAELLAACRAIMGDDE